MHTTHNYFVLALLRPYTRDVYAHQALLRILIASPVDPVFLVSSTAPSIGRGTLVRLAGATVETAELGASRAFCRNAVKVWLPTCVPLLFAAAPSAFTLSSQPQIHPTSCCG